MTEAARSLYTPVAGTCWGQRSSNSPPQLLLLTPVSVLRRFATDGVLSWKVCRCAGCPGERFTVRQTNTRAGVQVSIGNAYARGGSEKLRELQKVHILSKSLSLGPRLSRKVCRCAGVQVSRRKIHSQTNVYPSARAFLGRCPGVQVFRRKIYSRVFKEHTRMILTKLCTFIQ
jgi:hypothetical protein